jgi:hypothetical protein
MKFGPIYCWDLRLIFILFFIIKLSCVVQVISFHQLQLAKKKKKHKRVHFVITGSSMVNNTKLKSTTDQLTQILNHFSIIANLEICLG